MTIHAPIEVQAPRLLADFETRSRADLSEVGAWRYAEDPSTQILCLGYQIGRAPRRLWTPWFETEEEYEYEEKIGKGKKAIIEKRIGRRTTMKYTPELAPLPQDIVDHVANGGIIEAHNAGMEQAIWYCILHKVMGYKMPTRWRDTMAVCAYRGLPLALADVGEVLKLDTQKDKRGKEILNRISKPQKITKKNTEEWNNDPELFRECFDYCLNDVATEDSLGDTVGDLPPAEHRVWVLDQTINFRGIRLDFDAVYGAKAIAESASTNMEAELRELTQNAVETGNQRDRLIKWLDKEHKIFMPDMKAGTVKETLKDQGLAKFDKSDPSTYPRRVLEIRQELCRTSTEKLYRMLECVGFDGRIRGLLQYHGAGTGRWAGRLVQPQNFPRPKVNGKPFKGDIEHLIQILMMEDPAVVRLCYGPEMETIAASLRGMFIAAEGCDFLTSDFSSIEARIVLWLAGQDDAMDIFLKADRKEGPDIYCYLAGQIYGRTITKEDADERQLGKIGTLGCGYQMGASRLQEQAHDDYELDLPIELCERIVKTYRETFKKVTWFWKDIENAACNAVLNDRPTNHHGITYEVVTDKAGKWLACRLPSGRRIWYFNPHVTMEFASAEAVKKYPNLKGKMFPKLWYEGRDNKRGGMWTIISTYGGMLTENIVQAIARDCMVEAMLRAELAGYKIVLTVHDEVVSEQPFGFGSQNEFDALMAQQPLWAKGLPIAVEGWRGPRYHK